MSRKVTIEKSEKGIILTIKWFETKHVLQLIVGLFLLGFYYIKISPGAVAESVQTLVFMVDAFFTITALVLFYFSLAGFLNKTIITANQDFLTIRHTPVKWKGNNTFAAKNIEQLFVEKHLHPGSAKTQSYWTFKLILLLKNKEENKKEKTILSSVGDLKVNVYIESQIEKFYKITNRVVEDKENIKSPVFKEEMARFFSCPRPRQIPKSVHKKALKGIGLTPLLFGLGFTLIMGGGALIILVSWNMLNDFRLDYHNLPVPGTLIHKELHSNPEDTFKVFKYKYTFKDKSGIKHRGISYWTKGSPGVGQDVEVQYLPENPKINRITGSRNSELGWFVLIFCILPLIGPGIMIFSLFPRAKKLRLLRYGECANGIITKIIDSQWRTGKHIKIFKVKVEFKDLLGKKWKTTFEIKGRGVLSLKEKMKNVDPIPLLYNSKNPKQVFIAT